MTGAGYKHTLLLLSLCVIWDTIPEDCNYGFLPAQRDGALKTEIIPSFKKIMKTMFLTHELRKYMRQNYYTITVLVMTAF